MITDPRVEVIKVEEGYRRWAYLDTIGNLTIGYGHVIGRPVLQTKIEPRGPGLSVEQAEALLADDLLAAEDDLMELFGDVQWVLMDDPRQAALLSMRFQLGAGGFRGFVKMIDAVKLGNWDEAARECLDSLAAEQTPGRYKRNAEALRTNDSQWSVLT